jgi:microcystin degradation protein MlrC
MFSTETNTFSSLPTGWRSFSMRGIYHGDATIRAPSAFADSPLGEWRRMAEADGHDLIEGFAARAAPAGRVPQPVYERLRDDLLATVRAALPLDVVLLDLHGAMVASQTWDCTADIVGRVRDVVGPDAVIGVELDLHCQITAAALELADIVICYKEYPHTDVVERAQEVYRLCCAAARGLIKPTAALFDCRMVGGWPTIRSPMQDFVQRMQSCEGKDGVLSVSLAHGFPWGDVPACGAKIWVTTDHDRTHAEALAEQLGREFYDLRREMIFPQEDINHALDAALASDTAPWVLADVADNAGGGAPGDSTFILRRLLERGVRDVALGCMADPAAVGICLDAGVGACLELRLGGKLGRTSGDPVDIEATVRAVSEDHFQGPEGGRMALGPSAWIEVEGIDIVVCTNRIQVYWQNAFTDLGIDLTGKKLIVVKSSQHFYTDFSPIAAEVRYISTPGTLDLDFARLPYTQRDPNYWPRVADPLAG